jgi:hypothetical protein
MINHSVHMRDQKANQIAMRTKIGRQSLINTLEEITLVVVLWVMYILATAN